MEIRSPRLAERLARVKPGTVALIPFATDPAIDDFLAYMRARRSSPRTVKNYNCELRLAEKSMARPLTSATRETVNAWAGEISDSDYKASTIGKKQACLRTFFRWALKNRRVAEDPTVDLEAPRTPDRLPIHLRDDQVARLFGMLSEERPLAFREAVAVKLLYYTGMRAGELVGLTWERIDLAGNELTVVGKGDKERKIPIAAPLAALLARWREAHQTGHGAVLTRIGDDARPITYDTVYRMVRAVLRRAGLDGMGFSPHKFRHTAATRLLHGGLPMDQIQRLLGHRQISTTQIYAHTEIDETTRRAMDRIL